MAHLVPPKKKRSTPVAVDLPEETPIVETEQEQEGESPVDQEILDVHKAVSQILKFTSFEPEQRFWLDTGIPELNAVLGSKKHGLPYGKMYELSGVEHGGKTLIGTILGGMAQKDGAVFGYLDVEDSRDEAWATKMGVDWRRVFQIAPKLVRKKKGEIPTLQSAEELFAETEAAMQTFHARGFQKQYWLVDSIAMLQTEMVIAAGSTGGNMRTHVDRAAFLSSQLPTWTALAANYNAMIVLVNQLREKVGMVFGDPTYTPGGRALRHCCSIRARVKRMTNGRLVHNGKVVGIVGTIKNVKNKAGKGSNQDHECGFRIQWNRPLAEVEFMSVSDAEAALKGK